MWSEQLADNMTSQMERDAMEYVNMYYPVPIYGDETRNEIAVAFVEGGTAALNNLKKELQNGRK